jgi:spermidine synthase
VFFVDAFRVALVGRKALDNGEDLPPLSLAAIHNMDRLSESSQRMATGGEGLWTWLGRYWGPLPMGKGAIQDEWAPRIEFALPRARYSGKLDLAVILNYLLHRRPSAQQAATQLQVPPQYLAKFENDYHATELAHESWLSLLTSQGVRQDQKAEKMLQTAYQLNPQDRWIGFAVADGALASLDSVSNQKYNKTRVLESVLKVRPDHPEALLRLWRLAQAQGNTEKAAEFKARFAKIDPLSKALQTPQ